MNGSEVPLRAFQSEILYHPYVPPSTERLNQYVTDAQSEDREIRRPTLVAALQTIRRELHMPHSTRIIYSAQIIARLAWTVDDLWNVVNSAETLIQPELPIAVRESASEALKNASWHPGDHVSQSVRLATANNPKSSPTMRYNFVKAVGAATRHSRGKLKTDTVGNFLERSLRDENPVIARRAKSVFQNIFG